MDSTTCIFQPPSLATTPELASSKGFAIYELLEKILLKLSFKQLLALQQVSKHVLHMLETSRPLRQKLNLEPASGAPYRVDDDRVSHGVIQATPPFCTLVVSYSADSAPPGLVIDFVIRLMDADIDKYGLPARVAGKTPMGAHWWDMYLIQPPPRVMEVEVSQNFTRRQVSRYSMDHEVGFTLGAMFAAAMRERARGNTVRFRMSI
ncbi:hypothetical protein LTR78_001133 [Recurvomyces mirabilis]|uniref:F-box domain-containing protein n=1 Tax=Recurvomyces mirabilis TaxID=574656 RepID=A0AAE0WV68_9PEZI|nr:hypothetical protein LTR78_001133 [Recurvomyces mirabilis]KAK5161109.1 hypothetical protein LTS14_000905 [Recurvomyces mirabilis]